MSLNINTKNISKEASVNLNMILSPMGATSFGDVEVKRWGKSKLMVVDDNGRAFMSINGKWEGDEFVVSGWEGRIGNKDLICDGKKIVEYKKKD